MEAGAEDGDGPAGGGRGGVPGARLLEPQQQPEEEAFDHVSPALLQTLGAVEAALRGELSLVRSKVASHNSAAAVQASAPAPVGPSGASKGVDAEELAVLRFRVRAGNAKSIEQLRVAQAYVTDQLEAARARVAGRKRTLGELDDLVDEIGVQRSESESEPGSEPGKRAPKQSRADDCASVNGKLLEVTRRVLETNYPTSEPEFWKDFLKMPRRVKVRRDDGDDREVANVLLASGLCEEAKRPSGGKSSTRELHVVGARLAAQRLDGGGELDDDDDAMDK